MRPPHNHEHADDWAIAVAVRYLLRRGGWPEHSCRPDHLRRIAADRPLAAYLRSVQQGDVWDEEIARVRHHQMERRRERRRAGESAESAEDGGISVTAVMDLLPAWREWGNLLLIGNST